MKTSLASLPGVGACRSGAGSVLVIVLCFGVLLTVVVLAMLSHSISSGLIANASSNVNKADLYGHGAINQVIGDLKQEIVAGSVSTVAYTADPINGTIYRPTGVTNSVPYNAG